MANNNINIDFEKDKVVSLDGVKIVNKIVKLSTGKRHVIKINDISLYKNTYVNKTIIKTKNLIDKKTKSLAIFANEYIPEEMNAVNPIKYTMTVNGQEIEMVPINYDRNGIKIVKMSESEEISNYTHHVNDIITSAYLTITMNTNNEDFTPFISNLKILKGDKDV